MKDAMMFYAKCSTIINRSMNEILTRSFEEPYNVALQGLYFKNFSEILDHTFVTDMIWMKAFCDVDSNGLDLIGDVRAVPAYGEKVFTAHAEYLILRLKLDAFIEDYMSRLSDDIFGKTLTRITKSGQKIEKIVYKAMIHFFNHQTHHRGQISNILDTLNIENDYSNMISLA